MNSRLKPYDEYRGTKDLLWINSVPNHWKIIRNSLLFREVVDTNNENLELLSILMNKGIVKQSSTGRKIRMSQDNSMYKKICLGDIGYNLMNAFMGAIGASRYEGIISPAYAVCRPKIQLNSWYYHYLFRTPLYKTLFDINSYGIMYERNRLYFDRFKQIKALLPPIEEQNQIVRYLDNRTSKINKFIKEKKKLIEVLKEQKQAIISRVITKGLDDNSKMKPSGIEWLGDIPEEWKPVKLKFLSNKPLMYGANESGIVFSPKLPRYIRITDIDLDGSLKDSNKLSLPRNIADKFILADGDILFARSGATVGKTFLYKQEYGECCFAGYMIKFSPNKNLIIPEFLYYFTLSGYYKLWLNQNFIQSTIQNVSAEKYKEIYIALPPIDEQKSILLYIKTKLEIVDKAIDKIKKEIDFITEYRTSLISNVVIGRVDVRGINVEDVVEELEGELEDLEELDIEEEEI